MNKILERSLLIILAVLYPATFFVVLFGDFSDEATIRKIAALSFLILCFQIPYCEILINDIKHLLNRKKGGSND